jgi:hypothetical protein
MGCASSKASASAGSSANPWLAVKKNKRLEIVFAGNICAGPNGDHGTLCTSSFPGDFKAAWDALVEKARTDGLSTACVFLTAAEQGRHATDPETGKCWCFALYGKPQPWGCEWFERWARLVNEANERGQIICVFYKAGYLASVGAENTSWSAAHPNAITAELDWDELAGCQHSDMSVTRASSVGTLKAMPGLGVSQKGEVAYLKKKGIAYMRVDVNNGVPDAEATADMLGARADALDLATAQGRSEGYDVAEKLFAIEAHCRALPVMRALVSAFTEARGASDIDTLGAKNNLAVLLKELGEKTEACPVFIEVIEGFTTQLAPDHAETLMAKMNLATLLAELGENTEARALVVEVIAARRRRMKTTEVAMCGMRGRQIHV